MTFERDYSEFNSLLYKNAGDLHLYYLPNTRTEKKLTCFPHIKSKALHMTTIYGSQSAKQQ